jgi:hypothetical protein
VLKIYSPGSVMIKKPVTSQAKLVDGTTGPEDLVQGPTMLKESPTRSRDWDIPIICFREENDAFSYLSKTMWPTVNFRYRGSTRYLGVDFHSICTFFTTEEYEHLTHIPVIKSCEKTDYQKSVESFEVTGFP